MAERTGGLNGTRRLGVVVPSVNTVVEGWYPYVLPEGIHLATGRMLIGSAVTAETLKEMDGYGLEAARTLATCRPEVVVYGCTASSLLGGREYDLDLMRGLSAATGVPTLTTTESVLRALAALGVRTVAAASPYTEEVGGYEVDFLAANGHPVMGAAHLGVLNGFDLAAPSRTEIGAIARAAWRAADASADAVFIGCMNLNSHLLIDELETELGVPVVTATQAALWAALREMGGDKPIEGYGRLLREEF